VENGSLIQIPIPELQLERKLRLIYRRQATLSHAARAFLEVVEAYAAKKGDPFCFQSERGI